jgi:hypothetical protein
MSVVPHEGYERGVFDVVMESRRGIRRDKMFGHGRLVPLDRNAKVRVMMLARALMRRTEKGRHYGIVTAKFVDVLRALLWGFHNAAMSGRFTSRPTCSPLPVVAAIPTLAGRRRPCSALPPHFPQA